MISFTCQNLLNELSFYDQSQFIISSNIINKQSSTSTSLQSIKKPSQISFEHIKQFDELHEYITSQSNKPFIINSQPNSGKKVFLCQYMNHCQKHEKKTIFLSHFSYANNIYSDILFKIMVKLRILFGINQKVEMSQQRIRRYFKYWLQVTSQIIQKQNIGYSKKQKTIVVIIIDRVDLLTDFQGKSVDLQFWLPKQIPKNIKLVLTLNQEKNSHKSSGQKKWDMLFYPEQTIKTIRNLYMFDEVKDITLNLSELKMVNSLKLLNKDFQINTKHLTNFKSILQCYIQQSHQRCLTQNQIKSLLLCLILTKKGLTIQQLANIIKLKTESIQLFIQKFSPLISGYKQYYIILSPYLKQLIRSICDPLKQKQKTYHQIIAKVLKKQSCSIRKLQEQIYHLEKAEMHLQIKEILSQIQNFLVLYNPMSKYFLCLMWSRVQKYLNSDPIFEYNKGVQSFISHYYLKQQELYKIIFQLSMFFKQYSQFQNSKTPQFRHSILRGEIQQLQKTSVNDQLNEMKMTCSQKLKQKKSTSQLYSFQKDLRNKMNNNISESKQKQKKIQQKHILQNELQSDKILPQDQKQENQLQIQIQKINVSTGLNQSKFKQFFLNKLDPYLKQYYVPYKKILINDIFLKTSSNQQDEQQQYSDLNLQTVSLKATQQKMILKQLNQYLQQNYHRQETRKYYYYKIWLWVQFPWICQSLNFNFSQMIKNLIGCNTSYMSIDQQVNLMKESLKISKISKQNKCAIYQHRPIQLSSIRRKNKNDKNILCRKSVNFSSPQNKQEQNVAKFNLNLSLIDQKLNKQLQLQLSHRKMYDSRILRQLQNEKMKQNEMSAFLTEAKTNIQEKQNNLKLPKLLKNDKAIKLKIIKNELQSKNQMKLIDNVNIIVNQNKELTYKIQQVEKSSIMYDNIDQNSIIESLKQQIQQFQIKKKNILKQREVQQKLKAKLQTIIKICDNNKRHESETEVLNTYLDSIKKMNLMQKNQTKNFKKEKLQKIRALKKQIQQLKAKKLKYLQQFSNNKNINNNSQDSKNQSFKSKKNIQFNKQNSSHNIKYNNQKIKLESTHSKNNDLRKKKKMKSTKIFDNNSKILDQQQFQRLFFNIENRNQAKQILNQNQTKILKLNEINLCIQQLEYQKLQKLQKLEQIKNQISSVQKKQINQKSSYLFRYIRQKKDQLTVMLQRRQILQDAIKMIF